MWGENAGPMEFSSSPTNCASTQVLSLSVLTVYIYIHASCGNPSLVAAGTYQRLHIRFPPLVCLPEMLLPRDLLLLTTPKRRQTVAKINRIQRRALVDV